MNNLLQTGLGVLRSAARSVSYKSINFPLAQFSTTASVRLREIQVNTKDNVTTVEGKMIHEDNKSKNTLVIPGEKACPLCKLNMKIRYTDVLILHQFLREDGCLLPRRTTGVCGKQQNKLKVLVRQAQRAGLMPNYRPKLRNGTERHGHLSTFKWKKYAAYFDEK